MVIEMAVAKKHQEMPEALKKKMMDGKKSKEGEAMYGMKESKANVFEALLQKRHSESGMHGATMDTMRDNPNQPTLINHPGNGSTDVNSGVTPDAVRTPRFKIAGSAGDDPAKMLENAQEEGGVSLAGSQVQDEGEVPSPFRVLASLVIKEEEEVKNVNQDGPGFDPVR